MNDLAVGPLPIPCTLYAYQLALNLLSVSDHRPLRLASSGFSTVPRFQNELDLEVLLPPDTIYDHSGSQLGMGFPHLDSSCARWTKSLDAILRREELLLLCFSPDGLEN